MYNCSAKAPKKAICNAFVMIWKKAKYVLPVKGIQADKTDQKTVGAAVLVRSICGQTASLALQFLVASRRPQRFIRWDANCSVELNACDNGKGWSTQMTHGTASARPERLQELLVSYQGVLEIFQMTQVVWFDYGSLVTFNIRSRCLWRDWILHIFVIPWPFPLCHRYPTLGPITRMI